MTHFDAPDYVSDVAVNPGAPVAALVLVHLAPTASVPAGEILSLDLSTSSTSPLVGGADPRESLGAPVWWFDNRGLLFQREDITTVGTSYAGGATVQYPSRVEQVNADGSGRTILAEDARQPAASPDGVTFAFVRRVAQGPTLVIRSLLDGSERVLIDAGQFGDIVSPRYSPRGDRIAFMAPEGVFGPSPAALTFGVLLEVWPTSRLSPRVAVGRTSADRLRPGTRHAGPWSSAGFSAAFLGAPTRVAHGAPWDLWVVAVDGTSPPVQLAPLGADDGTVAWSPDGAQLFVYGGTGSFIVDANSAEVTPLSFVSGYGATSWVSE
ncbi:MAG TPA: hypothetical protein VGK33_17050 [Chloroflexota bacterium]